ncbi:MAG: hypothetical protein OXL37_13675 [Chloroflexota bacterium]|nr:hypothetical protein [Chloroflexota bacterium]MDE2959310.1 hypothetical protein [Chloroflexota bacterium]
MDARAAAGVARAYAAEVFASEEISQLGLEEAIYDPEMDEWRITVGFARPWDQPGSVGARLGLKSPRTYKVVHIDNPTQVVTSITERLPWDSKS